MKKTVIIYGTFDIFYIGHLKLFQRLAELIVTVSTDTFNELKKLLTNFLSISKENIINEFKVMETLKKDFE